MESIQFLLQQAHALWRQGNEQGMIEYLEKAIHLCRQEKNDKKLIEILNEYGGSYVMLADMMKLLLLLRNH